MQCERMTDKEKAAFLIGWQFALWELGNRMRFNLPKEIEDTYNNVYNAAITVRDRYHYIPAAHVKMLQLFIQNILDGKHILTSVSKERLEKANQQETE